MESHPKIQAELIHLIGEYVALRFTVPEVTSSTEVEGDELYAMFAVDKSGSMSGSPMNDAKGAAESLTTKFRKMDLPVAIYPFDSRAKEFCSDVVGYDTIVENLQKLKAGGGTIFQNVMEMMIKKIREQNLKNIFVVWLTDGQDNNGLESLIPIMDAHKKEYEDSGVSISIQCIGFSSEHDATLLTKLSTSGTRPGTFQYVPEGGRIPVAVNNVYNLAFESTTWARFIASEGKNYKVSVEKVEGTDELRALVYVSENDLEECKVELHKGSTVSEFEVELNRSESRGIEDLVFLATAFISSKVVQALEKGIEGAGQRLTEMVPLIEETDRRVENLLEQSRRLRPYKQKQLQPYFNAAKDLTSFFFSITRTLAGAEISNEDFAKINGLANALFLKRNLEKKIAKESGEGLTALQLGEEEIDRLSQEIKVEEIRGTYEGQALEQGVCSISRKNWIDCISTGDCLCITFQVERPQNLMGSPYETKVTKVNATMLSHDSFLNSNLFETKAGQIIQGPRNYQHGKEPVLASQLVDGLFDEYITGLMPVFITKEHWQFARLRLKQMLAYAISVDVLDTNETQVKVFPFLIMARALSESDKYSQLICNHIVDTCQQVYLENKDSIIQDLHTKLMEYITNPNLRLSNSIIDNSVILCQLHFANLVGDLQEYRGLVPYIFEEEVRRAFRHHEDLKYNELCLKVLDIEMAPYFEPIRTALMSGEASYADKFRVVKQGGKPEDVKKEEKGTVEIAEQQIETPQGIQNLGEYATKTYNSLLEAFTPGESLGKLGRIMKLFGYEQNLESLGLITNEQKLAFIIQCIGHKKDADRSEAILNGKFCDPFNAQAAHDWVLQTYKSTIEKEILAYKSQLMNQIQGKESEKRAAIFAMSEDLEDAAGCVYGMTQGNSGFPLFVKALKQPNIPHIIEKVKMITLGHFEGVKLILDEIPGTIDFVQWKPTKKTVHEIWKVHKDAAPKEQWQEAFPHKFDYFDHLYLRMQGVFVPYSKPKKNVTDQRHWEGKDRTKKTARPGAGSGRGRGRGGRGGRGRGGRGRGGRAAGRGGRGRGGRGSRP